MQHHLRGCNDIPSILQWTTPITHSLCEGWTRHDLHILVTAPFCCDRKFWAACAQSFALWQQATIKFTCHDHSIIACSHHIVIYAACCERVTKQNCYKAPFFLRLELKRYERNLIITFSNYTPDKCLQMYWCYFLFHLFLSRSVFHLPSRYSDQSVSRTIMLLLTFIQSN